MLGASVQETRRAFRRFLTADQVEALVVECDPYGLVVRFLAYTGLR